MVKPLTDASAAMSIGHAACSLARMRQCTWTAPMFEEIEAGAADQAPEDRAADDRAPDDRAPDDAADSSRWLGRDTHIRLRPRKRRGGRASLPPRGGL